jgi:hypothetical protein
VRLNAAILPFGGIITVIIYMNKTALEKHLKTIECGLLHA